MLGWIRFVLGLIIVCAACRENLDAQTTQIPDPRFEELLIELGLDEIMDGAV